MQGYLMTDMAILMLHKNVSRETLKRSEDKNVHLNSLVRCINYIKIKFVSKRLKQYFLI